MVLREKANIAFLQEAKVTTISEEVVASLFGSRDVDWKVKGEKVRTGGILTMWKTRVIDSLFSSKGEGFIGFNTKIKNLVCFFVNIYSPCSINLKMAMRMELVECRDKFRGGE